MRYKSRASSKGLALLGVTIFSASLGWDYITAHADTTPTADPKAVVKTTNVEPVQTNGQSNQTVLKTGSQPVAPTPESKPAGTPTATESTSKPATTDATQPTTPGVSDTTAKDATQPANGQKVAEPVQPKAAAGTETKPVNQGTNTTQPTTPVTNQNVKSGTAPAVTPDKTDGVETPDNATKNVQPVTTTSLSRPQPLTRSNLKLNRMSLAAVPEAEPVTVPDEADDIASGDFGTHWEINSKGILKIHGGTLADTKGSQRVNNVVQGSPWKDHVADIKGIDVNVDGTVYTGADASYLFSGMDKLGNLDLTKLNTSKTVNMESMLDGLNATSVNVSGWDVSNVTNGDGLFESTSGFTNLDLTSWDVSSFKTMRSMFWGSNLATVNTTGWQPKHVTTMASMFEKSRLNQIIGLEDWDTSSLTSTQEMFYGDKYLTKLDLSHWNVANLTNIYIMVDGSGVQSIDISNWNTPKLTSASSAFENNINMTTFKADNWNAENVTSFEDMLAYNTALKDVGDTGTWNVKSVQNVAAMFFNSKVAKLDLSTWNMDHVTSANAMLNQCQNLWYLKLGPHSTLVGGMLPTVGSSSLYDPKTQHYYSADSSKVWQTLGDGDVHWPKGNQTYTSAQLMALYQDSQPRPQNVETYVWKQQVMQATAGLQNNADNPVVTIKAFDGQPGPAELDPSGYLLAVTTPDNQKISYQLEKGDIRYQSAQLAHPGQYRVELTTQAVQKLQQKFKAYNWNLDTKITGTYTILPKPETINDFHFQFAANKTYDGQIMANPTLTFKTWDGNTINVPTIQDDYRAVQDNKTVGVVRDAGQYDLTFAMSNVIARLKQQLGTQAAYYDFTVNPIGDQTYSTTYTIAKRDLHVDMKEQKEVYARQMFHYNVANVSVTNGVSNDNLSYYKVDDPRMVDAGTYQIGLHFTYPNNLKNYNVVGNTTANLTITPATLNVTIPDDTVTYNGKVQTISKSKVKLGGIYSGDTLAFTVADSAGADVGVYPIKISLVKDDFSKNYQLPADAAGHLTIKQAQLFVKMHSRTVQYDGREQTLLPSDVEVTNSNTNQIVGADEVPYTLSSGRGVGTHDIKITFTDPQTVKNYAITGTDQPGTLTITPAVLTPDFSGVATRVIDYDGKTHTFDGVKLNGVLNNDPISFTVDQTASADAGTYQLGVHLNANAANDNYVLAGGSDYLTIDPVLVNATLANQTVTYNGKQ
ncbi:BspA family leucine-rich repeat surface protein [Lactiplantibacillus garii]|uniref:BspA family leucine-rich repeat surface protein n=1 Tax=Lactiplantibacillus garii TaxID=2306423 RepID=A0A3R8LLU7_9LACO|nr:BspA family leucine-rich repeat surface protein [Lactiplantibacillus garii]RRK11633.1 BspA family leucine-rich repeat surface protein [Lactiplantibacillus garii]